MLVGYFLALRAAGLPVSVTEFLALLDALRQGVAGPLDASDAPRWSLDDFYHLSRTVLVKDERHFDRFDRAFAAYFRGVEAATDPKRELPADWLQQWLARQLSPEQRAAAQALGWDELMRTLAERLAEQRERHAGGSKWIGTGGTSPFGHGGFNPAGVRIGGPGGGRSAVKVWEQRAWRDYDDTQALDTRGMQVALRRLQRFAREGAAEEFDLNATVRQTAANAGMLDIRMRPERRNAVKVLLLLDVGGSMDEHVRRVEALFAAARSEFRRLECFYFHNCVYDHVWRHNRRRHGGRTATWDLLRTYGRDWRLVMVGDATMSPYEILQPGGSVEFHNDEAGATWLQRLFAAWPHHAWINPEPRAAWEHRQSIALVRGLAGGRMFPLTPQGLAEATRLLSK